MSIFGRAPELHPKPRGHSCHHCPFAAVDPEVTLAHMFREHGADRRGYSLAPHPGRRSGDAVSPAIQRFMAARENGEGLGRPTRRPSARWTGRRLS